MRVKTFDIDQGIYHFELSNFKTELHSHPAVEVIYATSESFSIVTSNFIYTNVAFAVIDANIKHQVIAKNCDVQLLMLECNNDLFYHFLTQKNIAFNEVFFVQTVQSPPIDLFQQIRTFCTENVINNSKDERIQKCLNYFNHEPIYHQMVQTLKSKVHLSESRLSHLFKEKMGTSLKKYLNWSQLKSAFHSILEENINLNDAALQSGFYDQAHLSKTFKQMLGISPSEVYNSRTLQD